ncbi:ArsR family transcriptional regulator [archaeon]|nr:ArsR family transcriptional regulator [archaeon]
MKGYLIIGIFLLLPFAFAIDTINYKIYGDKVLVEASFEKGLFLNLPKDYSLLETNSEYLIQEGYIYLKGKGNLSFITKSFIDKNGDEYFFVVKEEENIGKKVSVYLPEYSNLIERYIVYPKDYSLKTNGQNIILSWENITEKEILVPYSTQKNNYWIVWPVLLILLGGIFYKFSKNNKEKIFSKNLFREEKEIVEYLIKKKNKSCWTKEIVKELGISKVRLSRKLRNLEEKGLIKKEPHGNENRIILQK